MQSKFPFSERASVSALAGALNLLCSSRRYFLKVDKEGPIRWKGFTLSVSTL